MIYHKALLLCVKLAYHFCKLNTVCLRIPKHWNVHTHATAFE